MQGARVDSAPFVRLDTALTKFHVESAWSTLAPYGTLHTKKEVSNDSNRIDAGVGGGRHPKNNKDRRVGPAISMADWGDRLAV